MCTLGFEEKCALWVLRKKMCTLDLGFEEKSALYSTIFRFVAFSAIPRTKM